MSSTFQGGIQQGTQQKNSYTKHAVTNRIPVTAKLGRVNEASQWNLLTQYWDNPSSMAKSFFRRK